MLNASEVSDILNRATVVVRRGNEGMPIGTGWLLSRRGYVVTAGHVLKNNPADADSVDRCEICFGWNADEDAKNEWLEAKRCVVVYDKDHMLDYAVLKIAPDRMPGNSCALPVWTGEWPYSKKCYILGYDGSLKELNYLCDVEVSGNTGEQLIRLKNQSLVDGYSGAAVFAATNDVSGVFAIQVARYVTTGNEDRDTRFGMPLTRIIDDWAPFEDLILTSCVTDVAGDPDSRGRSDGKRPRSEKATRMTNETAKRIKSLTGEDPLEHPVNLCSITHDRECPAKAESLRVIADVARNGESAGEELAVAGLIQAIWVCADSLERTLEAKLPSEADTVTLQLCIEDFLFRFSGFRRGYTDEQPDLYRRPRLFLGHRAPTFISQKYAEDFVAAMQAFKDVVSQNGPNDTHAQFIEVVRRIRNAAAMFQLSLHENGWKRLTMTAEALDGGFRPFHRFELAKHLRKTIAKLVSGSSGLARNWPMRSMSK